MDGNTFLNHLSSQNQIDLYRRPYVGPWEIKWTETPNAQQAHSHPSQQLVVTAPPNLTELVDADAFSFLTFDCALGCTGSNGDATVGSLEFSLFDPQANQQALPLRYPATRITALEESIVSPQTASVSGEEKLDRSGSKRKLQNKLAYGTLPSIRRGFSLC